MGATETPAQLLGKKAEGPWSLKTAPPGTAKIFLDYIVGEKHRLETQAGWGSKIGHGVPMPAEMAGAIVAKTLPMVAGPGDPLWSVGFGAVLEAGARQNAPILDLCRWVPVSWRGVSWPKPTQAAAGAEGSATEFAEFGNFTMEWAEEGAEASEAAATFEEVPFTMHLCEGYFESSGYLVRGSGQNWPAILATLGRESFRLKLLRAVLAGSGSGKPLGILNAEGVQEVNRAGPGAVAYADFLAVEDALPRWLQERAAWVIGKDVLKALKTLAGESSVAWLQELAASGYTRLLGHPLFATDLTALGAAGDVLFGDFSQYVITVCQDVSLLSSSHHKFRQGVICYLVEALVDGRPVLPRAFVKLVTAE